MDGYQVSQGFCVSYNQPHCRDEIFRYVSPKSLKWASPDEYLKSEKFSNDSSLEIAIKGFK